MISIAQVADIIGAYICEKADLQSRVKEVCYGLECILVVLLSLAVFMTIGWLAGVYKETLMITIGMFAMKYLVGGPHLSKLSRCIGFSAVFIESGAIFIKGGCPYFSWWLLVILLPVGITAIFRYAPLLTPDKEFGKRQKKRRRILASLMLLIVITIQLIAPVFWITGFLLGNLFAIFNITPSGVTLIKRVETLIK